MKLRTTLHDPSQVREATLHPDATASRWLRSAAPPPTRPAPPPPRPRRGIGTALLVAAGLGALVAGLLVSNHYETDTLGQRIDATVARGESAVRSLAGDVQLSTDRVVQQGAEGVGRATLALGDAGITASIKASLAADPALSALKIDVSTRQGVVTLSGPAPTAEARDRATVLARAPQGVQAVNNELVLPGIVAQPTGVTAPPVTRATSGG